MTAIARREALRRVGSAALVFGASAAVGRALWDDGREAVAGPAAAQLRRDFRVKEPGGAAARLALAKGAAGDPASTDPRALTRRSVEALGGMARFVARGDVVAIKPNIGWDRTPVQGANTHPLVVAELVALALAAGARRVVVSDFSCNDPARAFQRSGIAQAAAAAGAEVILPAEHRFREMHIGGEMLDDWPVLVPLLEADKVINVPVAKHHGHAKFTGALKNWYGLIGGRREKLHQRIDVSIADLAAFVQPTLTVIDATRVLWRNGPQGGDLADTRETHTVVASTDQVAADAYACELIGLRAAELPYLAYAVERGLGTSDWQKLSPVEA